MSELKHFTIKWFMRRIMTMYKRNKSLQAELNNAHLSVAKKMAESAGWEGDYDELKTAIQQAVEEIDERQLENGNWDEQNGMLKAQDILAKYVSISKPILTEEEEDDRKDK